MTLLALAKTSFGILVLTHQSDRNNLSISCGGRGVSHYYKVDGKLFIVVGLAWGEGTQVVWVGVCRTGLQRKTPFKKGFAFKVMPRSRNRKFFNTLF